MLDIGRFVGFILIWVLIGCKGQSKTVSELDGRGELIATISFNVQTNDTALFEDGIIPWVNIEKPQEEIPNLVGKDEIVIKQTDINVMIDYPLTHPYGFSLTSKDGFSRKELLTEISKHYFNVYAEEEKTATIKTIPIDKRTKLINRNKTNGKFGIWGHDIADLILTEILVYKSEKGEFKLILMMAS